MTCLHEGKVVPVETGLLGNVAVVAHLCADCLASVPVNTGCTDCQWANIMVLGNAEPVARRCTELCDTHRKALA